MTVIAMFKQNYALSINHLGEICVKFFLTLNKRLAPIQPSRNLWVVDKVSVNVYKASDIGWHEIREDAGSSKLRNLTT